jgi:hypothetical protein
MADKKERVTRAIIVEVVSETEGNTPLSRFNARVTGFDGVAYLVNDINAVSWREAADYAIESYVQCFAVRENEEEEPKEEETHEGR